MVCIANPVGMILIGERGLATNAQNQAKQQQESGKRFRHDFIVLKVNTMQKFTVLINVVKVTFFA
jgi:hypothetical protein